MYHTNDLPSEIRDLLGSLSEREGDIRESGSWDTGEEIAESTFNDESSFDNINVIPSDNPGSCQSTLLVIIGAKDSDRTIDNRILEAIEHIYVKCPGITRSVVFWAAKWNSQVWSKRNSSFRKVTVVLKPFLAYPTILNT